MKMVISAAMFAVGIISISSYMLYKSAAYKAHGTAEGSSVKSLHLVVGKQEAGYKKSHTEGLKEFIKASNIEPELRAIVEEMISERPAGSTVPEVAQVLIDNAYNELGMELLEDELMENPLDVDTLLVLGSNYQSAGMLASFKSVWEPILTQYPDRLDLYVALAQFYADAVDVKEGISILERGIKSNPMNNDFRYVMGDLFEIQGMNEEAEQAFADAFQVNPTDAIASLRLGELYWKKGETAIAESYFAITVQLAPEYAEVIQELREEVPNAL